LIQHLTSTALALAVLGKPCRVHETPFGVTSVFLSRSPLQGHLMWLCRATHQFTRAHPHRTARTGPKAELPHWHRFCRALGRGPARPGARGISHLQRSRACTQSPLHVTHFSEGLSLMLHSPFVV